MHIFVGRLLRPPSKAIKRSVFELLLVVIAIGLEGWIFAVVFSTRKPLIYDFQLSNSLSLRPSQTKS